MSLKRREVIWTEDAVREMEEIVEFIALDDPQSAMRMAERLVKLADGLVTTPFRGRVVPELDRIGHHGHREVIVSPYRIMYRVLPGKVIVDLVIDGRRNVEDYLGRKLWGGRARY